MLIMTTSTFIGIDPGINGAIVAIDDNRNLILCEDMPYIDAKLSMRKTAEIFSNFDPDKSFAAIEIAVAMNQENRTQSVASMLAYGRGLGILQMCVYMTRISCTETNAAHWMSTFGVNGKTSGRYNGDKIAVKLIPQLEEFVYKKSKKAKDGVRIYDGRADAALIAEWRLRKYLLSQSKNVT